MHGRQLACQPGWGRLSEWGREEGLGQGWEGSARLSSFKNRSRARTVCQASPAFFSVTKVNWQPLVRVEMLSDAMIAARK